MPEDAAPKPTSPWSGYVIAYSLKKLAEVRKREGLTQDEVAAKVGRTGAWLSTLKATGGMRLDTVAYIAQLLGIDLPEFIEAARCWATKSMDLFEGEQRTSRRPGLFERLEAVERSIRESGVVAKPTAEEAPPAAAPVEGPNHEVPVTPQRQPLQAVQDASRGPRPAPKRKSAVARARQEAREGRKRKVKAT